MMYVPGKKKKGSIRHLFYYVYRQDQNAAETVK